MLDAVKNSGKQRGRPFKAGASGNPRGRPRGSRNKRTRAVIEAAEAAGELPLEYMLKVMRDANAKLARRDDMAKAAAPYLHPRLAATERPSPFQVPELASVGDASKAIAAITAGLARGDLTPGAAGEMVTLRLHGFFPGSRHCPQSMTVGDSLGGGIGLRDCR
jgi:hypothetical protein